MYSFDGKHKTRTKVSLGGNSKQVGKMALIESARGERMKRERTRREYSAVLRLQAWTRSCLCRNRTKTLFRQNFDSVTKELNQSSISQASALIHFFYNVQTDFDRLVALCQSLLKLVSSKQLEQLFSSNLVDWCWRIKRILVLCSKTLPLSANKNVSIPLRMLEVFTNQKTVVWLNDEKKINQLLVSINLYLMKKGYFWHLRELLNKRVPNSLEPSATPPTPLADAIKDLIFKPLKLFKEENDTFDVDYMRTTNAAFIQDILAYPMTEQICYFLIPAIARSIHLPSLLNVYVEMAEEWVNVWMLYSVNTIFESQTDQKMNANTICDYTKVLKLLIRQLKSMKERGVASRDGDLSDDDVYSSDEDDVIELMEVEKNKDEDLVCYQYAVQKCFDSLNGDYLFSPMLSFLNQKDTGNSEIMSNLLYDLCSVCHHLISILNIPIHKSRFLCTLALSSKFLRLTWYQLLSMTTITNSGKTVQLLHQLSHGNAMTSSDQDRIVPMLSVYTTLLRFLLFSIYDSDFFGSGEQTSSLMPFTITEVIEMSRILRDVILGLIVFMYPDTKMFNGPNQKQWHTLCQSVTLLVKQLYARDCRRRFCPENHWLSARAAVSHEAIKISVFLDEETAEKSLEFNKDVVKPGMSTLNARNLAILEFVPFAVPFLQRVLIFQRILQADKKNNQNMDQAIFSNQGVESISINRKYLYQDAYDQLSKDRCQDIKRIVRVQMINAQGLDEAGIDGGGVFREFMAQLIKEGYDPSYGFFNSTTQQLLYPSPDISLIHTDYLNHFHFLGRMLGKVIYESMMVELPLADFFLCKLLNKHGADVDIHHLESMDPELYKNLFDLKNYSGDADDLCLNFTTIKNLYGEAEVIELKPGGRDICVNNTNKIEYIHLTADYKLNKQLRNQCNAFRAGLSDVIDLKWLQMFSHHELQILISGAHVAIDINDLKKNTTYSGAFSEDDSYIREFWSIMESLTDKQKQQFLKFVTSCSRPPLLGFSELYPKFCIHSGGEEDRLPTASTCMNFLKLPKYNSKELLRKRLIYAIEAEAGFELS